MSDRICQTRSGQVVTAGVLFCAIGVMTGCGTTGGGAPDSSTGATSVSSSYFSPLQEYLSPSNNAMPTSPEEYEAQDRRVQDLIVPCMTENGFEYRPFVYVGMMESSMGEDVQGRAWTEKYGYGISTFDQTAAPPEQTDPNQAIVEAMGDAERQAYFQALYGSDPMMSVESSAAAQTPTTAESASATAGVDSAPDTSSSTAATSASSAVMADQGCWGKAQAEVYGAAYAGGGVAMDEFQDMWDSYSTAMQSIETDPELAEMTKAWASCMADSGHAGYTDQTEPNTEVNDRWAELNGWNTMPMEGDEAALSAAPTPSSPPAAKVSEFRTYEIALALADFDCKEKVGYAAAYEKVRIAVEQRFLEENRSELERYRDIVNGGG